ncbi:hypothetical protein Asfd1_185 [Aeromonas phage Asfd_1]|nr:hypothetical protein Asfd1_185 [Aeromonas phage Asfd_1]
MKPYGHSRKSALTCQYGCCTFETASWKKCRKASDRVRRKAARSENKSQIICGIKEFNELFASEKSGVI